MKCLICKTNTSSITTTELRRGKGSVYFCEACDLGMLQLQEKQEKRGREYYSKEYRKYYVSKIGHETNAEEMFNISSPYQKDRVDLIKDKLHPDMKLLDIGCSAGQFLYAVKPYVSEIVCIDYDEKATKHASSVCD